MPRTKCPIHGLTGCVAVCEHVSNDFVSHHPLRSSRVITLAESDTDILAFPIRLCEKCLHDCEISDGINRVPFEATLDKYPQLETPKLFCSRCFDSYLQTTKTGERK